MLVQRGESRAKANVNWRFHVLIFITAFVILVLRRPDAFFNPQFWAEDGSKWYAEAYNFGAIPALFLPYAGYLSTFQRLIAAFTLIFPLILSPLIFNLAAIIIQILPVTLITSSRFSTLIFSLDIRLFLAFIYLFLPNSHETHANLTNSQWNLALLAYMVIAAQPSSCLVWRFFDIGVILLSGLSGPYAIFLIPIAVLICWHRPNKNLISLLFGLIICGVMQAIIIKNKTDITFIQISLYSALKLLSKITGGQLFLGPLIGKSGYAWLNTNSFVSYFLFSTVAIAGIAAFIYALIKAPLELKLFIIYSTSILGAALLMPLIRGDTIESFWGAMSSPSLGGRYYFLPRLAFVSTLVWMMNQKPRQVQIVASIALATMLFGIILDFRYPAFTDFKFREYVDSFMEAQEGTKVTIPINPPGWTMQLIK